MTKTLIIMRHAKSDWSAPGLSDHDRPLNERGQSASQTMGKWLKEQGFIPDLVLCSSAARTRQTLDGLKSSGLDTGDTRLLQDLYLAGETTTRSLISTYGDAHDTLMMIGHNPTSHSLAVKLALGNKNHADQKLIGELASKFPSGAAAIFDVDCDNWDNWHGEAATLTHFMTPQQLA